MKRLLFGCKNSAMNALKKQSLRCRQNQFRCSPLPVSLQALDDSNSTNAVNLSSACTTKGFLLSRCGSAIQIVCPLESTAETRPQLQHSGHRNQDVIKEIGHNTVRAANQDLRDARRLREVPPARGQQIPYSPLPGRPMEIQRDASTGLHFDLFQAKHHLRQSLIIRVDSNPLVSRVRSYETRLMQRIHGHTGRAGQYPRLRGRDKAELAPLI